MRAGEVALILDELGPRAAHGGPWDDVNAWDGFPGYECDDEVSRCTQHHQDVGHGAAARVFEVAIRGAAAAAAVELAPEIATAVGLAELFGGAEALAGFEFYEVAGFGTLVAVSRDVIDAVKHGKVRCWTDKVVHGIHSGRCEMGSDGPNGLAGDPLPGHRVHDTVVATTRTILEAVGYLPAWWYQSAEDEGECKPRWPWLIDAIEDGTYVPTPGAPEWWLDRIDQRSPMLDCKYEPADRTGRGVHIYLVDAGISWIRRWSEYLACKGRRGECDDLLAPGDPQIPPRILKANHGKLKNLILSAGPRISTVGFGTTLPIINDHGLRMVSILHKLVPEATLVDVNIWDFDEAPKQNVMNWTHAKKAIEWIADHLREPAVVLYGAWYRDDFSEPFERIANVAPIFVPAGNRMEPVASAELPRHAEMVGGSYLDYMDKRVPMDVIYDRNYARPAMQTRMPRERRGSTTFGAELDLFAPAMDILVDSLWETFYDPTSDWVSEVYADGTSQAAPMWAAAAAMYLQDNPRAAPDQVYGAVYRAGSKVDIIVAGDSYEEWFGTATTLVYLGKEAEAIWAQ